MMECDIFERHHFEPGNQAAGGFSGDLRYEGPWKRGVTVDQVVAQVAVGLQIEHALENDLLISFGEHAAEIESRGAFYPLRRHFETGARLGGHIAAQEIRDQPVDRGLFRRPDVHRRSRVPLLVQFPDEMLYALLCCHVAVHAALSK